MTSPVAVAGPADRRAPAAPARRREVVAWSWFVGHLIARAYRAFLGTLLTVALLPTVWSWSGYVVHSGSMEPAIGVGDVVVAQPFDPAHEVPLGRVVIFPHPAKPDSGELLVHRVVERLEDGTFATAGDANDDYDAAPVTSTDLDAQARLLVPYVGHAVVWLSEGRLAPMVLWTAITAAALVLARRRRADRADDEPRGSSFRRRGARRTQQRNRRTTASVATGLAILVVGGAGVHGTHLATASFTSRTATASNTWTAATAPSAPYTAQVMADAPYAYYQVDEASGSVAADSSGNARTGTFAEVSAYRQTNGLPRNAGHSVRLGGAGRLVGGGPAVTDPNTYSLELWFRTTSTAGGRLIGFESTRNAASPLADRHVYLRPDGRLEYGGWVEGGGLSTITSPEAYNNGGWHHVVLTATPRGQRQDSVLYVDGRAVASGTTTRTAFYSGWWRVGSGTAPLLTGYGSASFDGGIDQVAIYSTALSAARVESHWAAR